jgi:hypothetical protein
MRNRHVKDRHLPWLASRLMVWLPLVIALVGACGGGNGNSY